MFQLRTLLTILQVLQNILHNPNTCHTLVSYVGTILITVTIVHLKSRLSTIRTHVSINTLIIFHKLHRVFHNNIFGFDSNSCYDSNSFGFDQVQPPQYTVNHPIFNSQNELLNSSNKLMEQMTTLCDLVGQAIQKKEEEKRIAEEQAAKDRYWKIPICYDDDEDNTIAITPVLPIEEPDNSLSMGDEHLDTIPETESDEVIKSSVESLIPIPSESEGIPDNVCDVPLCNNPTS
ncbi:hypothetical protein Tco_0042803, partial [Tanacetum coccineum]